jgi:hypothetical protein
LAINLCVQVIVTLAMLKAERNHLQYGQIADGQKLSGDGRSRLRPAIAQRFRDVQPSHGVRSVEIGQSASHSQRRRTKARKIAALV